MDASPATGGDLRGGEQITSNLRLVAPLGKGSMGGVWLADNLVLSTRVAVKIISRDLASSPDARARFAKEAAAASQVRSPHAIQIFDYGLTTRGLPFISMELLEGEDLAARLRRIGPLAPRDVATIVWQAAKALVKAHERGIVHRDIKPENLFLCHTDDGEIFVKVIDFGIARLDGGLDGATRTGALMGTVYYMSPEQIAGSKDVDHLTDVWALGVLTYELLTGFLPFDGDTIAAIALSIHRRTPVPPTRLRPGLPPRLDEWFDRACSRDRRVRFQSARELSHALWHVLAEASHPAAPPLPLRKPKPTTTTNGGQSTRRESTRPTRREPRALVSVAAAAVLVTIAAVVVVAVRLPRADLARAASEPPTFSTANPSLPTTTPPSVSASADASPDGGSFADAPVTDDTSANANAALDAASIPQTSTTKGHHEPIIF